MQPQNILNVTGNAHCKKMLIAKKKIYFQTFNDI